MEELQYKLSFESKEDWETVKESLATVQDENTTYPWYASVEIGHVPIYATFDEEGNELTPQTFHEDYAVDVMSKVEIPEFTPYLIEAKEKYVHRVDGNFKIVTKT